MIQEISPGRFPETIFFFVGLFFVLIMATRDYTTENSHYENLILMASLSPTTLIKLVLFLSLLEAFYSTLFLISF